jgi:hypothetical protein
VEELTKDKAELKRSNDLMRTQLDLLEQQNRTLLMNQLSAQPLSLVNGGNFIPGGNFSTFSMLNHVGNHTTLSVNSMSGGMPMFNLSSNGFGVSHAGSIGSGITGTVGGASNLPVSNASTSFMGGSGGLGQISLLDRLRLQQQVQLQQQQQQQQQQHAPPTDTNDSTSLSNQDLIQNNAQNNSSNNNNFLGGGSQHK